MKKALALGLILLMVLSALAFAGKNPQFKVAIHVLAHGTRSCAKNFPVITGCENIITTYPGINVDFFPVFFNLVEFAGAEYGVMWEGSSCTFTSCSSLTIGDIKNPGNGISHAWTTCQRKTVCLPGFGWVYSYGFISMVPHPMMGGPSIGDCDAVVDTPPFCNFKAGTNGHIGDDPCQETATEESTWGSIKAMFR